jgi:AcrR family transcriptional regulator
MSSADSPIRKRRRPVQRRSRQTVEWVLEGAARVFRAEGFGATTNRIAAASGIGIGTLYEYFPNKQALLFALAERHVVAAEQGVARALAAQPATPELLAALQAAIVASHRYPSQALELATGAAAGGLRDRALALRRRVLAELLERARAAALPDPELRARIAFGLIAELSSITGYESRSEAEHAPVLAHLLELAVEQLAGQSP